MSFNTFCGQDPLNPLTYNRVLLRFQELGGGGGGVATVNNGTNINIAGPPANPTVNLDAPLTSNLDLGGVDVVDSGGLIGAAGTVLSSNGAGLGTSWIAPLAPAVPPVATVSFYRNLNTPIPVNPINSTAFPECELTAGGIVATVNQLYDPVAAAALGLSNLVLCEFYYSAAMGQSLFFLGGPSAIPNNQTVNNNGGGVGPLAIYYETYFSRNGGVKQPFANNQGHYGSSMVLAIGPNQLGARGLAEPSFQTNVVIQGVLDTTGFAPLDTIRFIIEASTQYVAQRIDIQTGANYFCGISVKTSMTR